MLAFFKCRYSHSICSFAADGSSIGKFALRGFRIVKWSRSDKAFTTSACQSGQPVIPPARKRTSSVCPGLQESSVRASTYFTWLSHFVGQKLPAAAGGRRG